jgi:hypothetical protein
MPLSKYDRFRIGDRLIYRDHDSMTSSPCMVVDRPGKAPDPASALVAFPPNQFGKDHRPSFFVRASEDAYRLRVGLGTLNRPSPEVSRLIALEAQLGAAIRGEIDGARADALSEQARIVIKIEMSVLEAILEDRHPYIWRWFERDNRPFGLARLVEPPPAYATSRGPTVDPIRYGACVAARRLLKLSPLPGSYAQAAAQPNPLTEAMRRR